MQYKMPQSDRVTSSSNHGLFDDGIRDAVLK
jgi:hypothetical protein